MLRFIDFINSKIELTLCKIFTKKELKKSFNIFL